MVMMWMPGYDFCWVDWYYEMVVRYSYFVDSLMLLYQWPYHTPRSLPVQYASGQSQLNFVYDSGPSLSSKSEVMILVDPPCCGMWDDDDHYSFHFVQ